MLKRLFLVFVLLGLTLPFAALADGDYKIGSTNVHYQGFVPCGKSRPGLAICKDSAGAISRKPNCDPSLGEETIAQAESPEVTMTCQLCHTLVMIDGIIDYVLINIVPPLAVLMIVVGGIMFYFAGGKPELLGKGKKLITGVIIGLFLIYGAYLIVGTFLLILGVTDVSGLTNWATTNVFSINCPIH